MEYQGLDEKTLREKLDSSSDFTERRHIRAALRRLRDGDKSDVIKTSSTSSLRHSDDVKKPVSILDSFNSHEERRATFAWRKENGKIFTKDDTKKLVKEAGNPYEKIMDESKLLQLLKEANDLDERINIRTALWKLREKQGKPIVGPLAFPKSVQLKASEERKQEPSTKRIGSSSNLSNLTIAELEEKLQKARNYSERKNIRSQILQLQRSQALNGRVKKDITVDHVKTKNDTNLRKDTDVPKYVEIEIKDAGVPRNKPSEIGQKTYSRTPSADVPNGTSLRSRNSSGGSTGSTKGTPKPETRESSTRSHPAFRRNSFSPSITELRSASRRNSGSRSSESSRSQSPTATNLSEVTKGARDSDGSKSNFSSSSISDLEDKISELQKELDASSDFDRRREIRAEIRKIKAKMKDTGEKSTDKVQESSKFGHLLRKKPNEKDSQKGISLDNTKEVEQKVSVSVLRTRTPDKSRHAEQTTTVENKRTSKGGTQYEEVDTITTRVNKSARGSQHYETDWMTQRRIATKSGSEFNELDVTIEKDGYSATKDRDYQETAKAQMILTKSLGQAMRRAAFLQSLPQPDNDLITNSSNTVSNELPSSQDVQSAFDESDKDIQEIKENSEVTTEKLAQVPGSVQATSETINNSGTIEDNDEVFEELPELSTAKFQRDDNDVLVTSAGNEDNNATDKAEPEEKPQLAMGAVEMDTECNDKPWADTETIEEEKDMDMKTLVPNDGLSEEVRPTELSENREMVESESITLESTADMAEEVLEEKAQEDIEKEKNELNTSFVKSNKKDENHNIEDEGTGNKDQDSDTKTLEKIDIDENQNNTSENQDPDVTNLKDLPVVTLPLQDLSVNDGDPASFSCEVEAPDNADVCWYRGSKLLEQSLDYTQIREGNVVQLLITETFSDDEGEYKCVVSTDIGSASTTAKLTVADAPAAPVAGVAPMVERHLVDKMVIEGDKEIILQCQITGTPEPTVTWYCSNRKLPNCSEFEQTYNGVTHVAKMVIAEVFLDDEGEYCCIAENACGRAKSSCWIAVEDDTEDGTPCINKPLKDIEAFDGDELTLVCEVSGSPKPDIYWFHGEKKLSPCQDFEQSYDGKVAKLVIDEVLFPEDSGIYKCIAENSRGKTSTHCKVTIHDAPATPLPSETKSTPEVAKLKFIMPLVDKVVTDGNSTSLACKLVKCNDALISWYKDDEVLQGVDYKQSFDGETARLDIQELFPEDRGTYSCVAKLGSSEVRTECKLTVTDPPSRLEEPKNTSSVNDFSNADDKSARCTNNAPGGDKDIVCSLPPDGQGKIKKVWPPTGENKFAANFSKFQASSKVTNNRLKQRPTGRAADKFLPSSKLDKSTVSKMDINSINDEDELFRMMEATQDFDERKKIRARMKVVREAKTAEWERQRAEREATKVDPVIERQRKAEEAKQRKLQQLQEADRKAKETTRVDVGQQVLQERQIKAQQEKQANMQKMVEIGTAMSQVAFTGGDMVKQKDKEVNAKLHEQETKRATRTEQGPDGSMKTTTTTVTTHKTQARQPNRPGMSAFNKDDSTNAGEGVAVQRSPSTIKQMLLDWCKQMTADYEGVNITNFSSSWNDGMAFCALSHHFWPDAFDYSRLQPKFRKANFAIAFDVAEKRGGIAKLLDVEDMVRMRNPDWKCVFTYIQQFYRKYREGMDTPTTPTTPTSPMATATVQPVPQQATPQPTVQATQMATVQVTPMATVQTAPMATATPEVTVTITDSQS